MLTGCGPHAVGTTQTLQHARTPIWRSCRCSSKEKQHVGGRAGRFFGGTESHLGIVATTGGYLLRTAESRSKTDFLRNEAKYATRPRISWPYCETHQDRQRPVGQGVGRKARAVSERISPRHRGVEKKFGRRLAG